MEKHRPSYNQNRMILGKELPLKTPLSIRLDASERCNFQCGYCFRAKEKDESWGFAASNALMSWETFERCVGQMRRFSEKIRMVSLSGHGEPLCNPRIAQMARYLRESGLCEQIDMHTNGSLLTETSAKEIAQAGFTRIVVSLQGLDAEAYKKTCGALIDFDQFCRNLELLYQNKAEGLRLHIKIADTALCGERFEEEAERFYERFDRIADFTFIEKIVPIWENQPDAEEAVNKFNGRFGDIACCSLLFYGLMVSPEGEMIPCTRLPPPVTFGNVYDSTLWEGWNGEARRRFLKDHLRLTRKQFPPCRNCYTAVNCVMTEEDIIDPFREEILSRLEEAAQ